MLANVRSMIGVVCVVAALSTACRSHFEGPYAGTWQSDGGDLGGTLRCEAERVDGKRWRALFAGKCADLFEYEVEMNGRRMEDRVVFWGEADLGQENGDIYTWTGQINEDKFTGKYETSSGQKAGSFTMTRQ